MNYRVVWSRPGGPNYVAANFPADSNDKAVGIFDGNFKNSHVYAGDDLKLLLIVQEEKVEVIATSKGK